MRRTGCAAVLAVVTASLLGCTPDPVTVPQAVPSRGGSAQPGSAAGPVVGDVQLLEGPLERRFKSSGLTFNLTYEPVQPVDQWTADGAKSLQVSLTASNTSNPSQKVYLTRVTLRPAVQDVGGALPSPDPVVDTANLIPGYLVTFPYSYEQTFAVPPVDASAAGITLAFKFELVTLVDAKARDYTKQTTSDAVQIALNS